MILEQPREPALHDFAHHPEIIAGGDVGRFDVELAVLVFHEPFRPGDDHAADGIGAHDVGVVVDLDAARRMGRFEGLGQPFQKPRLAGAVGKLAGHAPRAHWSCVGSTRSRFSPRLGFADLDAPPALWLKASAIRSAGSEIVRGQDQLGDRLVVVELREEALQHLARLDDGSALGK
jgi:hypothetical protein